MEIISKKVLSVSESLSENQRFISLSDWDSKTIIRPVKVEFYNFASARHIFILVENIDKLDNPNQGIIQK